MLRLHIILRHLERTSRQGGQEVVTCAAVEGAVMNRRVVMLTVPRGEPKASDFEIVSEALPAIQDGQMLLRTKWLTLDPYMRGLGSNDDVQMFGGYMREEKNVATTILGGTVSEVVDSQAAGWSKGDLVVGYYGWQEYSIATAKDVQWNNAKWPIEKWNTSLGPPSTALGILGMTGYTAYFGLLHVAKAAPGDVVVVSAASGAVGQVVGQIAKILGCRAVGIAGGPKKCAYVVDNLGFDACVDYKDKSRDLHATLKSLVPDGIDIYFENVGGEVLEAIIPLLKPNARVPVCGWVSQYNGATGKSPLARLKEAGLKQLGGKSGSKEGFTFFSFAQFVPEFPKALQAMSDWIREGKLKYLESISDGLESSIGAFVGMLRGENFGKTLVRVS